MKKLLVAAALAIAAFAYAVPGDLLVISKKEVEADAAAGLSYIGSCASGYLYSGSAAALGRVAPYRTLDRDAAAKDYYVVWAPAFVKLDPGAFAHLGFATRLSPDEVLVGVEKGMGGAAAIRAVEYRTELRLLQPVTRVKGWKAAAEPPPTEKDPAIEAAINAITADEYAGYIQTLQDYRTRYTTTWECAQSRDYIRNFLGMQNLDAVNYPFSCSNYRAVYYPERNGNAYLLDKHALVRRSKNGGLTWNNIRTAGIVIDSDLSWLDAQTGYGAGQDGDLAMTRDGGDTWETTIWGNPDPLAIRMPYSCYFRNRSLGWVGGMEYAVMQEWPFTENIGFLFKTADGGRTWIRQSIGPGFRPGTIAFFDNAHGWLANAYTNYNVKFKYTQDGGATWQNGTDPLVIVNKVDLAPVGTASAWAANSNGSDWLYHTTDGVTWTAVYTGISAFFRQIEFPDALHGFAAGSTFAATADGGATWTEIPPPAGFDIACMSFADANYGIVANGDGGFTAYTSDGGHTWTEVTDAARLYAENVIGERKGTAHPEEIVIIGGHYDSISDERPWRCPGAEDNASGAAVMMAAARAFRNCNFKRTVRFMAFGDEESGIVGSQAYANECAERSEKIVAVLTADMVSYDEEKGSRDDISVAHKESTYRWLFDYLDGVGALYNNGLIYDSYEGSSSDHAAFWAAGYPALGAIEGAIGAGGRVSYPYYHTAEDTFDKIQPAFGARFARDFAATLAHLAGVAGTFPDPPRPGDVAKPIPHEFAVYPNPYHVTSSAAGVHFVGLATPAKVSVYDIVGRKVASWDVGTSAGDECCWRPAAAGGAPLAAGVYLYTVEGDNQREAGKLALVK